MEMEIFLKAKRLDKDIMSLSKLLQEWDGTLRGIEGEEPFYVDDTNDMRKDIKARILKEIEIKKNRFNDL